MAMIDFPTACRETAHDIRNGSLFGQNPKAQHVNRKSWEQLAQINELGFLTWLSQDAMSMLSDSPVMDERSYVEGHMPLEAARDFVKNFNLHNDGMFATLTVGVDPRKLIKESKYLGITNREKDGKYWRIRGLMPSIDDERLFSQNMIGRTCGSPQGCFNQDLIGIQVVDLKWGRPATRKNGLWAAIIKTLEAISE